MKTTLRVLVLASFALLASWGSLNEVHARPPYYAALQHALPPGNKVANTTQCRTCHEGSHLNYFGQDFAKLVLRAPDKDAAFIALFRLDSDGDGRSNIQEMMEGTNPGLKDAPPPKPPAFR